jgi:hypothetical protein
MSKPTVFIHTNDQQIVGAYVGMYSMKKASAHPDDFDVKLIRLEETPHLLKRQGQPYLRKGKSAVWLNEDLQSFSPLRRMVPQLMGFQGRAVVTDPDVFAIGDIYELLNMDMGGKAIMCRNVSEGYRSNGYQFYASSVMLLDCAKLQHWRWDDDIDRMFAGSLDYGPWIGLKTEDPSTIGGIGEEWNSFDKLTPVTRLLHTTERLTQPWKTGLPIDFDQTTKPRPGKLSAGAPKNFWLRMADKFGLGGQKLASETAMRYQPHPDPEQERFFFRMLEGAIQEGYLDPSLLKQSIAQKNVRPDTLHILAAAGLKI